jgi:hypothetical protein
VLVIEVDVEGRTVEFVLKEKLMILQDTRPVKITADKIIRRYLIKLLFIFTRIILLFLKLITETVNAVCNKTLFFSNYNPFNGNY